MKKFFENLKKYFKYAIFSAKAELKAEVAGSYLNWVWWILEPVCFMFIYAFIFSVVFGRSTQYLMVFILIGLTVWNYFNSLVQSSVKLVSNNRSIVTKVYIPKYILTLSKSFTLLFKMFISWGIVLILMIYYRVPLTWNMLYFFPIMLVLYVVSFGISVIVMHFGIFVEDLANVVRIGLRLLFYLSGVFYGIEDSLTKSLGKKVAYYFLRCNPTAYIIDATRKALIIPDKISWKILGLWFVVGIVLTAIGARIIHKYENSYAKVI